MEGSSPDLRTTTEKSLAAAVERRQERLQDMERRRKRDRGEVAAAAGRILETEIDPESLHRRSDAIERGLWGFEFEGMQFLAGFYWHGNPSESFFMAVKVRGSRRGPEWPPPHPQSAGNTDWAPDGYKVVRSLAWLGEAIEEMGNVDLSDTEADIHEEPPGSLLEDKSAGWIAIHKHALWLGGFSLGAACFVVGFAFGLFLGIYG